jgi:hypothetical protein
VLRRKFALAMALAVAASLMLAGGALAKDRNHDRIPDKWEKRHHLSLHHKQGRKDQDHDGLKNRGEFRSHLDPRDADTDDDGIDDSDEHTGTVDSFENGVLTITLANGGKLSAAVTDETDIECDSEPGDDRGEDEHGDHHGDHGDDNDGDEGDDNEGDDNEGDDGDGDHGDDRSLQGDGGDHGDDEGNEDCGTEALVAGAKVLEAELKVSGGEAVWTDVELLTP